MKILSLIALVLACTAYLSCGSGRSDKQAGGHVESTQEKDKASEAAQKLPLAVGDDAPLFTLPGTPDKKDIVLADILTRQPVLLAFFPKAFTSG